MMKDDVVYNKFDNQVMVKTDGDLIYIICQKEEQQDNIVKRMTTDNCLLEHYEEWDDDEDKKWILTFRVMDEYEVTPNLN
jgi:hypothetical protein